MQDEQVDEVVSAVYRSLDDGTSITRRKAANQGRAIKPEHETLTD
jgi:hypothetical protein